MKKNLKEYSYKYAKLDTIISKRKSMSKNKEKVDALLAWREADEPRMAQYAKDMAERHALGYWLDEAVGEGSTAEGYEVIEETIEETISTKEEIVKKK